MLEGNIESCIRDWKGAFKGDFEAKNSLVKSACKQCELCTCNAGCVGTAKTGYLPNVVL